MPALPSVPYSRRSLIILAVRKVCGGDVRREDESLLDLQTHEPHEIYGNALEVIGRRPSVRVGRKP